MYNFPSFSKTVKNEFIKNGHNGKEYKELPTKKCSGNTDLQNKVGFKYM